MRSHLQPRDRVGTGEGMGREGMVADSGEKVGMAMPEWKSELCPAMNGEFLDGSFKGKT